MLSLQSTESICTMNRKDSDTDLGKNNWVNYSKSISAALQLHFHVSIDRQANTESRLYETELTWHVRSPGAVDTIRLDGCTFSEVSCNRQWHTQNRRVINEGWVGGSETWSYKQGCSTDLHWLAVQLRLLWGWAKPAMCSLSNALRRQSPGYVQ